MVTVEGSQEGAASQFSNRTDRGQKTKLVIVLLIYKIYADNLNQSF